MKIKSVIILMLLAIPTAAHSASPLERLYETAVRRDVPPGTYVYNWRDAVLLKALTDLYVTLPDKREEISAYVAGEMERVAPRAHGAHPNGIASAAGFAFLQEIGKNTPDTDEALRRVLAQYERIIRNKDGACSHRTDRVELWDDTLYMLNIAFIACYKATGDRKYLEWSAREILLHAKYLLDERTGLWYHGWSESGKPVQDACCQYGWNDNPLHRSGEFWGRGNGWIAMALADLLEYLPKTDAAYPALLGMFKTMMKSLRRFQDRKTGLWFQLPAHPKDEGNYLESSCSAMFGYAAVKGARLHLLSSCYRNTGKKAWNGITQHCLEESGDGVHLTRICPGTCIGDKAYYYGRGTVSKGETYALGAALMLANEMENY